MPQSVEGIDSIVILLNPIANDSLNYGSSAARSVISRLTGKVYTPFVLLPKMRSQRRARIDKIKFEQGVKPMFAYPNPFNVATTIEANVPDETKEAIISVTDIAGRAIHDDETPHWH